MKSGRSPPSDGATVKVTFKYVRVYVDRHGKQRVEYRRGGRTIPIRAQPGTAEFQAAYDAAKAQFEKPSDPTTARPSSPKPHTLHWLCVEYFKSAEFEQLSTSTQRARRNVIESMLQEPFRPGSAQTFADCPLPSLKAEHVKVLRDRKRKYPEAANIRLKSLRGIFKWADGKSGLNGNPARDVPKLKVGGDGYHSWTDGEREQFERRHPVGTKPRLAYALLFYTGQRRSDVVRSAASMCTTDAAVHSTEEPRNANQSRSNFPSCRSAKGHRREPVGRTHVPGDRLRSAVYSGWIRQLVASSRATKPGFPTARPTASARQQRRSPPRMARPPTS